MSKSIKRTILASSFVACLPAIALANPGAESESRASMATPERMQQSVDQAATVYRSVVKNSKGEVPASVLNNARCIAVVPSIMGGAVAVGGAHGEGLASCKGKDGAWSQPVPITLSEASIGLQAGAKSTDAVIFFQTPEAVAALKRAKLRFGADVSAVAGKYDAAFDSAGKGVVVYTDSEGVFAGASIGGTMIGKDREELTAMYGRSSTFSGILEGSENPDSAGYTKSLTSLFPKS